VSTPKIGCPEANRQSSVCGVYQARTEGGVSYEASSSSKERHGTSLQSFTHWEATERRLSAKSCGGV
jgi:hypothetical protein